MLGLTLRDEFKSKRLKGTAIELSNDSNTGATQIAAQAFLNITYPTHDLLKGIDAVGPGKGRPVVVIGERGLGKSHLMAALYHSVNDPSSTRSWLNSWSTTLGDPNLATIQLRDPMTVIGESLHRQRYKFLWDLLFDRHPHGTYIKGKWEGMGAAKTDIPSDQLIVEMLEKAPTMLLLDEFQTWFDGLTNTKQYPWKVWAFNFIQILSEIAKERPDLLVLVISVRNGGSDAYQQVHRVNPVAIDFQAGGNAERIQQDRRRMLLHRLFENRLQIPTATITAAIDAHVVQSFRLLDVPPAEQERKRSEFTESWPFAPHLLRLLEEQVLIATDAQETRDMIRILANLYKSRGESSPILTAADFRLDDDGSGIGALLDSVSNEHHRTLRAKAQQNIISVTEAIPRHAELLPHLQEVIGALWLRSIAVGNMAGAEPATLQVDITHSKAVDDNAFQAELSTIVENSFNIHQDGMRLVFREEENPRAKLMACARNDKLFTDGSDQAQLSKQIRYVIGGADEVAKQFRVIALPRSWQSDPWSRLEESERPDRWDDRLPVLVLPEEPENIGPALGRWLKDHLQTRRNTVRFLLPVTGSTNAFQDRDLLILARAEMKAQEWSGQNPEYRKLHTEFQNALRDMLKKRFDRFTILHRWNYADSSQCGQGVVVLRGGDHGAKTAAERKFRQKDGPRVLVCTAAGREGINLQFARILFNFDLPWNPMDLEQRIGRIHRYGQNHTAQVYNLVLSDTIEGRIFLLLDEKLAEIARTVGKVDDQGHVAEDLKAQILGQLSERLNYDRLYQEALSDPELKRTHVELEAALSNSREARSVVFDLFQDLDGFSLDDYKPFSDVSSSMARLLNFFRSAAADQRLTLKTLDAETYVLDGSDTSSVRFTTNRDTATSQEGLQLLGIDHPLIQHSLARWSNTAPEEIGLSVASSDTAEAAVLSLWKVATSTASGEKRTILQPIAVSEAGTRMPAIERQHDRFWQAQVAAPRLTTQQRSDLFSRFVEPTLQRELRHKGTVNADGSYSAELIGYVEISPA